MRLPACHADGEGVMKHGTFDYHRGMSFATLRTEITINNDGLPGGAWHLGPVQGAWSTHWNVKITNGRFEMVNDPQVMPLGLLVGIQGDIRGYDRIKGHRSPARGMSRGALFECDTECLNPPEWVGRVPNPRNLYLAQLKLRLGKLPDYLKEYEKDYGWIKPGRRRSRLSDNRR